MKCPKCNYTSSDFLDSCRKCGADLRDVKALLQIISVSPEERAPVYARESPVQEGPNAAAAFAEAPSAFGREVPGTQGYQAATMEEELLSDLNFDQSFEQMVEPTSYVESTPVDTPKLGPEDDGLLDLDFGDVFGEKSDKGKP